LLSWSIDVDAVAIDCPSAAVVCQLRFVVIVA